MDQELNNVETVEEEKVTAEPTKTQPNDKKYSDAEVDEIINKKFAKWKKEQEAEQSEAKKLKSMNADEKTKYNQEIAKRELMAEAKSILNERGLPVDLAGVIDLTDADTVKASIEAIGKQWEQAVQKGIAEKLKGTQPLTKAPQNSNGITKEALTKMKYQERLDFKTKNPDEYNKIMKG